MTTTRLSPAVPLHRPAALRLLDTAIDAAVMLQRWLEARHRTRGELRRAVRAERELAQLSPHTLQDIGAAQGLIGQRRWQEEQEATQAMRILHSRGW